MYLGYYC